MTKTSIWRESIHGTDYTIESTQKRVQQPPQDGSCNLVSVAAMLIPCFQCSSFNDYDKYLQYHQRLLSSSVLFQYLPRCCADRIALDFTNFVRAPANDHRCPTLSYTFTYDVHIWLKPGIQSHDSTFEDKGLATEPASSSYVSDSNASRDDKYEDDWNSTDHECSICIDDIDKPEDSLTLPCSHMFHESCLVRWLDTNDVCPLCRYELPPFYP